MTTLSTNSRYRVIKGFQFSKRDIKMFRLSMSQSALNLILPKNRQELQLVTFESLMYGANTKGFYPVAYIDRNNTVYDIVNITSQCIAVLASTKEGIKIKLFHITNNLQYQGNDHDIEDLVEDTRISGELFLNPIEVQMALHVQQRQEKERT